MSRPRTQRNPPRLSGYHQKKNGPLGHFKPNITPYFTVDALHCENASHVNNRFSSWC